VSIFANLTERYGKGSRSPAGSLNDPEIANTLRLYKKRIASRYQIVKPSRISKDISGKVWISAKIDGECWFLLKKGNNVAFASYNGRVIEKIEATKEATSLLKDSGDLIIAGELFSSGTNKFDEMEGIAAETGIGIMAGENESGAREKVEKVSKTAGGIAGGLIGAKIGVIVGTLLLPGVGSILGAIIGGELGQTSGRARVHNVSTALADGKKSGQLGFRAFDMVREGEKDLFDETYETRLTKMTTLLKGGKWVNVAPTFMGEGADDVGTCYQEWVKTKLAEGLVVRNENGIIYKIKPQIDIDAVIVAFGERKNAFPDLGQMYVALKRDDGALHMLGAVGGGFSDDDRQEWHERLSGMVVDSDYRLANKDGTLCRFVKPEIVVQIRCSDLLALDGSERSIMRMILNYGKQGYEPTGQMPMVSMIHPVFQKERKDKAASKEDVGLEQVYSIVPFEARVDKPEGLKLNSSKVLQREVYCKIAKEQRSIRKFVAIETNKQEQDSRYPPYVLYTTDFSPTRASPLKTDVQVAPDKKGLDALVTAWKDKNVKKGWEPV